jgi:WD40 repeat protein
MFLMVLIFITLYNNLRSEESDTLWTRELGGNGKGNIINAIFSPDDNSIFVTTTERFYEVSTTTGNIIREIPEIRGAKYLSSDGRFAYTYDLKKVDMLTKLTMGEFKSPLLPWYYYDFDVCENANMYVGIVKHAIQFPFLDSTIGIFDTQTFQLKKIIQLPKNYMEKVAISPNGRFIATNSLYEPNVQIEGDEVFITTIWDGTTYEKIKQLQLGGSNLLKFSPDGKYLGVGGGPKIYLYNTETWQLVDTFYFEEVTSFSSFAFSPNNEYIYAGGPNKKLNKWKINPKSLMYQFSPPWNFKTISFPKSNSNFVTTVTYSAILFKDNITSIKSKADENTLIYPNPVKNILNMQNKFGVIKRVVLSSINGSIINNTLKFTESNEIIQFDFSNIVTGRYLLTLYSDSQTITIKFIKE